MECLNPKPSLTSSGSAYPAWVREDLIQATLAIWQPYYEARLTRQDAVEMILAASRLLDALSHPGDRVIS